MRMRVEGHETRVLEKSDYSSGKFLVLDEKTWIVLRLNLIVKSN